MEIFFLRLQGEHISYTSGIPVYPQELQQEQFIGAGQIQFQRITVISRSGQRQFLQSAKCYKGYIRLPVKISFEKNPSIISKPKEMEPFDNNFYALAFRGLILGSLLVAIAIVTH